MHLSDKDGEQGTPEMPEMAPFSNCPIWPDFPSRATQNEDGSLEVFSLRTAGSYQIAAESVLLLGTPTYRYGRVRVRESSRPPNHVDGRPTDIGSRLPRSNARGH